MGRDERIVLIQEIERIRHSRVVAYVTGDRAPVPAQIGDDAVRPLYDHLRKIGHVARLDVFIYSRGGAIDVPWRLATAFRRTARQWNLIVPYRANSAATLLSLGADEIVLGAQGELGPIDPVANIQRLVSQPGAPSALQQEAVNVEDVMAYLRFLSERAGLSDQPALTQGLRLLGERIDAVLLGSLYRTHSHIRDLARRMLMSRLAPPSEEAASRIVEALAERVYAHGHAVGFDEAAAIGLPVIAPDAELDGVMWSLLEDYEHELRLREPLDPMVAVRGGDTHREEAVNAVIETSGLAHHHRGEIEVTARRQMPPQLNVNLNLNVTLPPGSDPGGAAPTLQQLLPAMQQAVAQQAHQAVQQAVAQQAPLMGVDVAFRGGQWVREGDL